MTKVEFIKEMTEMMLNAYEKPLNGTKEAEERCSVLHALYITKLESLDKKELNSINPLLMQRFKDFGKKMLINATAEYKSEFKQYRNSRLDEDLLDL